jgi:cytochrome d ubiquinol oxidase subunit I
VATSLAAFAVVYLIVFGAGFTFIFRLMQRTPGVGEDGPPKGVPVRSAGITPISALHEAQTVGHPAPAE